MYLHAEITITPLGYNLHVKSWDVVIVGGGIIGISLALELRKHGASVLVVDKGEPGREASHAAAGMLANCEQPDALQALASASAQLYPQFVREIEDTSGMEVDYRTNGTLLLFSAPKDEPTCPDAVHLSEKEIVQMESHLASGIDVAMFLPEASVDPRALTAAALKAARHRGVDISSGDEVTNIEFENVPKLGITGVATKKTRFPARAVVNCAGSWAGNIQSPLAPPTRPVKGHMLDVIPASRLLSQRNDSLILKHVIRTTDIYLVPRTDGRIVIGSTLEEAGFDKRINPNTIQNLFQYAANVCPELGQAKIHETWTGLRPGTPDDLPILGATETSGYYIANGHFRDGILLAPITAHLMTQLIQGHQTDLDIASFSPMRFAPKES